MVVRHRKKNVRQRRSTTHGWGSMKKHRGAGNRGGRGMAGTGAKGDAKKPSVWKEYKSGKDPSKRGFTSYETVEVTINVGHLNSIVPALVRSGKALEKDGKVIVNLRQLGYTKLLGAGKVTQKLSVSVKFASPKAEEKLKKAGGVLEAEYVTGQEDSFEDAPETEEVVEE